MKLLLVLLFTINILQAKDVYTKGDILKVKSCNKFRWCLVDDHYVKGHKLIKIDKHTYKVREDTVLKYQKNYILGIKYPALYKSFTYLTNDSKKNFQYGYTQVPELLKKDEKLPYFVSLVFGKGTFDVDKKNNQLSENINKKALDDSGVFIEIAIGKYLSKNISTQISISQATLEILKVNDVSMELNYEFDIFLNPFIGMNLGLSQIKWDKTPLLGGRFEKSNSDSYVYGAQAGTQYPITKNIKVLLKYKFKKYNHKHGITSKGYENVILHKNTHSLGLGIVYIF